MSRLTVTCVCIIMILALHYTILVICEGEEVLLADKHGNLMDTKSQTDEQVIEDIVSKVEAISKNVASSLPGQKKVTYDKMAETLVALRRVIRDENRAHCLLKGDWLGRINIPELLESRTAQLRKQLLILLKTLLTISPVSAQAKLDNNIFDKILYIFLEIDHAVLRSLSLDILNMWIPGNVKIQAHVLDTRGLQPFIDIIDSLSEEEFYIMWNLFKTILEEHYNMINSLASQVDIEKSEIYKKIGLMDDIATPEGCDQLIRVFGAILGPMENRDSFLIPTLKIMNITRPYCLRLVNGNRKHYHVLQQYYKYILNDNVGQQLHSAGMHHKDALQLLTSYLDEFKTYKDKDEF